MTRSDGIYPKKDRYGRHKVKRLNDHQIEIVCRECYKTMRAEGRSAPTKRLDVNRGSNTIDLSKPWTELDTITPDCCRACAVCTNFDARGFAPLKNARSRSGASPEQEVLAAANLAAIYAPVGYEASTRRGVRSIVVRMGFWAKKWATNIADSEAPFFWRVAAMKLITEDTSRVGLLETHMLFAPYPEHRMAIANFLNTLGANVRLADMTVYRSGESQDPLAKELSAILGDVNEGLRSESPDPEDLRDLDALFGK